MDNNRNEKTGVNENSPEITLETVWNRTQTTIETAIQSDNATLINAPPGAGKTTAVPMVANTLEIPLTYLTQRTDLYEQMEQLCENEGLSHATIPSPHRDCSTFRGDYGDQLKEKVEKLYTAGISGKRIHDELGLPCQPNCDYLTERDELDPEKTEVLIGNCQHAYIQPVIEERVVIIDEFPGEAFINYFENPEPIVSSFLQQYNTPYTDFSDLLQNRSGSDMALAIGQNNIPTGRVPDLVLNQPDSTHALAGPLTFGLAGMIDLENGFESTRRYESYCNVKSHIPEKIVDVYIPVEPPWQNVLTKNRVVVRDKTSSKMWLLSPPNLSASAGLIGLDGTPTRSMWNVVFDQLFDYQRVLDTQEMNQYLSNVQGYTLKQTTNGRKPYSSGNYVTLDHDAALIFGVDINHDESPSIISSKKALEKYRDNGLLDWIDNSMYYGTVKSSNRFAGKEVGIVSGSPHPGDQVLQRWGAFMGHLIPSPEQGEEKDYGPIGNQIYNHFVHTEVFQAILRFGRTGEEATVYLNTTTIPDWLSVDIDLDISRFRGEKTRETTDFIRSHQGEDITQARIQNECGASDSTVGKVLDQLIEGGYVKKHESAGRTVDGNWVHLYEWMH